MPERQEREANLHRGGVPASPKISSFFARMACKRRKATDSDGEAEEFARQQAAVHLDVMEALQQKITHPLLFSGKNLCLMTELRDLKSQDDPDALYGWALFD